MEQKVHLSPASARKPAYCLDSSIKPPFYETALTSTRKGRKYPKSGSINSFRQSEFANQTSQTSKADSNSCLRWFSVPLLPKPPVRPPSYSHGFRWCKGVSLLRGAGYALRAALACQPMLRLRGLQSLSEVDQGNVRPEVPKLVAHSSQCALIILECFRQDFQSLLGVCVSQPVNTPTPSQRSFGSTGE